MPPKGPWWRLFLEPGTKHKGNNTYKNAWCKGCVEHHVHRNRDADQARVDAGLQRSVRKDAELYRLALGPDACSAEDLVRQPFSHDEATSAIAPLYGRASAMSSHARKCEHVDAGELARTEEAVQVEEALKRSRSQSTSGYGNVENIPPTYYGPTTILSERALKRAKTGSSSSFSAPSSFSPNSALSGAPVSSSTPFPAAIQHNFGLDLCKVFVACGITWNAANNPELHRFFGKWLPQAVVPDRRALSGKFLDENAAAAEATILERVKGKLAMGQSDGWKNIAKTNLTTSMISVDHQPYLLRTHDMTERPKTGDKMIKIIKADIQYAGQHLGVNVIGWTTDDGPDGRKARRLLAAEKPYLILTVCWAHQINLVVGDLLSLPEITEIISAAVEIVKWFNAHSAALDLHREAQKKDDPLCTPLALILPVLTRWTVHYLSLSRLLLLSAPTRMCSITYHDQMLISAGKTADAKRKAEEVMKTIDEREFWVKATRVKTYLEPLAIAANVTQGSNTRLDHALVSLGNLHHIFADPAVEPSVRAKVHESLERRWKKADQDLYILAVFFNPYIRASCFSLEALPLASLLDMARRAFKRFYGCDPDETFRRALIDYAHRRAEFTDARMGLEEAKTEADSQEQDIDLVALWELLDASDADVCPGRNGVVRLAVHVLSAIVNAGGCERTFSAFGIIHTKLRNHLSPQKVHKTAVVGRNLREQHAEAGLLPSHNRKRKLGCSYPATATPQDPHTPPDDPPPQELELEDLEGVDLDCNFEQLVHQLRSDAEAAQVEEASPEISAPESEQLTDADPLFLNSTPSSMASGSQSASRRQPAKPAKTSIPLETLFRYPTYPALFAESESGTAPKATLLNFYWKSGIKNLQKELVAYDLLHASPS